jgi:NAD(P)-dependent dehydrogenase (short-subunit alcohol dehydrogenase family)
MPGFGSYIPSKTGVNALIKLAAPENNKKMITGVPDDIARVVIWLCSNEASFVNGNIISVNGGSEIT